jgi:ribosomal-protein-serine acetyltransferase
MLSHEISDRLIVDEMISLEIIADHHAHALLELGERNRKPLGEWLPWVPYMQTVDNFNTYIERCKSQHEAGTDYGYVIMVNNNVAGRIGIHYIDQQNKTGAIGYWLGEEYIGKGIVTKSCKGIIRFGFEQIGLNRIEIKCATANHKSVAIAERLNFKKEGILRQAEYANGNFQDLFLYSLLKEEWS